MTMKSTIDAMRAIDLRVWRRDRSRGAPPRRVRTGIEPGVGRPAHPGRQSVVDRHGERGHLAGDPDLWGHGIHRGVRRAPALPRCSYHLDLRRHERHSGHGSRRPQAAVTGWRRDRGLPGARSSSIDVELEKAGPDLEGIRTELARALEALTDHDAHRDGRRSERSARRVGGGVAVPADVQSGHGRLAHGATSARRGRGPRRSTAPTPNCCRPRSARLVSSASSCFRPCTGSHRPRPPRRTPCSRSTRPAWRLR